MSRRNNVKTKTLSTHKDKQQFSLTLSVLLGSAKGALMMHCDDFGRNYRMTNAIQVVEIDTSS